MSNATETLTTPVATTGEIAKLISKLADEHRTAPVEWIAEQVYNGIPESRFPQIVRELVDLRVQDGINRRGQPKGKTRKWYVERHELLRRNRKRSRVTVSIEYCAEGWYSSGGTSYRPSGDEMCSTFPASHIAGEYDYWWEQGMDAWKKFHETRPVLWKVTREAPGSRRIAYRFCDDELPDEYRRIVNGEGHLDGWTVPEWHTLVQETPVP